MPLFELQHKYKTMVYSHVELTKYNFAQLQKILDIIKILKTY